MPSLFNNNIDVSHYVSIGDSITAGYTDGALCYYGQKNVFSYLLAEQFKLIGGGDYKQPYVHPDSVGHGFSGNACLVLQNSTSGIDPTTVILTHLSEKGDIAIFETNDYLTNGPFNNIGIPGLKAISAVAPGYGNPNNGDGNYNPFFTRIASNPNKASILSDALLMKPSFFTLFLGNNDVLAYALSGGTTDVISPLQGDAGVGFKESIRLIVQSLVNEGASGVIANLPDFSSVPFFTTIPYNGLGLNAEEVNHLNQLYASQGIVFYKGKNPFVAQASISDKDGIRQLKKGEVVLLDILFDPLKVQYLNGLIPLPKRYVLNISERHLIQDTIIQYNHCLKSIAEEFNLGFVDVNTLLKTSRTDRIYNGFSRKINYKNGGVFSLDGLHPNAFGQALLANEFVNIINQKFQKSIPILDVQNFIKK